LGEVEAFTAGEFKASVVGAYERGERAISVQRFVSLAGVYGVPAAELLPITTDTESIVIDLDAISASGSDELADRYLAAIQLLRRDSASSEVRASDKAVLATLLEASVETKTQ
jgi:transcriptional regulator with XRE-family HTH domain